MFILLGLSALSRGVARNGHLLTSRGEKKYGQDVLGVFFVRGVFAGCAPLRYKAFSLRGHVAEYPIVVSIARICRAEERKHIRPALKGVSRIRNKPSIRELG